MPPSLEYVATRLDRALSRRPILPEFALLHRLCEVGSKRLDPRTLVPMLPMLAANGDSVRITSHGLYAAIDLSPDEADQRSEQTVAELQALGLNHAGHPLSSVAPLIEAADAVRTALENEGLATHSQTTNESPASFLVHRSETEAPLFVGLLDNVSCLYPDDSKLWQHLAVAESLAAHPVIVARTVAPLTFPLLATLNARALQYYELLLDSTNDATAADADALGLPRIRQAAALPEHPIMAQLRRLVTERPAAPWTPGASAAFEDAIALGFADGRIDLSQFVTWAQEHPELPSAWATGLGLWSTAQRTDRSNDDGPPADRGNTARKGYGRKTVKSRVPFRI